MSESEGSLDLTRAQLSTTSCTACTSAPNPGAVFMHTEIPIPGPVEDLRAQQKCMLSIQELRYARVRLAFMPSVTRLVPLPCRRHQAERGPHNTSFECTAMCPLCQGDVSQLAGPTLHAHKAVWRPLAQAERPAGLHSCRTVPGSVWQCIPMVNHLPGVICSVAAKWPVEHQQCAASQCTTDPA